MTHDHYLNSLRDFELGMVLRALPSRPGKILEVGSGSGWQAHLMQKRGYDLTAIDIKAPTSEAYANIQVYDGKRFPFADAAFNAVYISNVLDHVADTELFSKEVARVLSDNGIWILVLPTSSWAFWNLLFYYLKMPAIIFKKLRRRRLSQSSGKPVPLSTKQARYLFMPGRLGERGNAFSEISLFSNRNRLNFLSQNGWVVERSEPLHLFYTGVRLAGIKLPIGIRSLLSYFLGSSCRVYVMKKGPSLTAGSINSEGYNDSRIPLGGP